MDPTTVGPASRAGPPPGPARLAGPTTPGRDQTLDRTVDDTTCCIDDLGPLPPARPASVAELGDLIRRATSSDQAVYPVGGRTRLGLGLPPTKPGVAIDLTALTQVIDYPARDMTITVQA